ncbi:MAG: hypothetical protein QG642_139 [Patescibacteria group bacterium]|nr:hypothetical protein [Patescibacteria group bacterium]
METWKPEIKSEEDLQKQLEITEDVVGTEIVPNSIRDDIFNLSLDEIKERYPERYSAYLQILRAERKSEQIVDDELNKMKEWLETLNNLDTYITKHSDNANEDSVRLRDRQFTVFEDIRNALEKGEKEGYVKLPTGVGKTVLFIELIKALDKKTLVVVPTRQLVHQTGDKIKQFAPNLKSGKVYAHEKNLEENTTIITYDSLVAMVKSGKIVPEKYDTIILDEVHRCLSEARQEIINRFQDVVKIGFTATPEYSKEKKVSNILKKEIHSMGVREATETGLLSSFSCIVAKTDIDLSSVKILSNGEYDQGELEKVINVIGRNKAAVDMYEQGFKGKKAIAFCLSINHANDVAQTFIERGIQAVVISGRTPRAEQGKIIQDFESGNIDVLLTVNLLTEGFDAPNASVCLNLAPTHSLVRAEQRAGRVLRLDDNDLQKHAFVVDFLDKDQGDKRSPVIFPEIVGDAVVSPKKFDNGNGQGGGGVGEPNLPKFNVDGLKMIVDSDEVLRISKVLGEYRNEFKQEAALGWQTASSLRFAVRSSKETIKEFAEQYRENHPEWFGNFWVFGQEVEHYHPDLVDKIITNLTKIEALEGWETASKLSQRLQRDFYFIKKLAEQYRESHPEWFVNFLAGKKEREHYHPELIELIKKNLLQLEAPVGWATSEKIASEIKKSPVTIKKAAEQYRESHPEWFGNFWAGKQNTEYYHPELIEIISKNLLRMEAPLGWFTVGNISGQIKSDGKTIKKLAEQYRESHPEWFGNFWAVKMNGEFYHPDLVEIIKNELATPEAPLGWFTARKISEQIKSTSQTIKKIAEQYRESHPEWFGIFKAGPKKPEYYHPNLIEIIKRELIRPEAPDGWKTATWLKSSIKVNVVTIKKIAEQYRESHPEWFGTFWAATMDAEFYHPDLVEEIKRHFG